MGLNWLCGKLDRYTRCWKLCVSVCYKHRGRLATNTWSSHHELFPRWSVSLSASVFAVASLWEISSCLKRFPLHWLCFRLRDLRWFVWAFVALLLRFSLGFLQPSQQGLTWKCSQDVLFSKRPSLFLYLSISVRFSHWYSSISVLNRASLTVAGSSKPDILSCTCHKKRATCTWSDWRLI